MLQSQGSSPTMVFASDTSTSYPQLHQPQQGLVQIGTEGHGIVNQAEALRRTINAQIACIDGYGDVNAQVPLNTAYANDLVSLPLKYVLIYLCASSFPVLNIGLVLL